MAVPMKGKDGMVVGEWSVEPLRKTINNITYTSSHTPYNNNGDPWALTHSGMYLKLSRGEGIPNQAAFHKQWSLLIFVLFHSSSTPRFWCRSRVARGSLDTSNTCWGRPSFPWIPISLIHLFCFDRSDLLAGLVVSGQTGARPFSKAPTSRFDGNSVLSFLLDRSWCASGPALSGVRDRRRERRPDDAYHNFLKKYNANLDTPKLSLNAPKAGREEDEERPVQKQASREDRKV